MRTLVAVVLAAAALSLPVRAEEPAPAAKPAVSSWAVFFKNLRSSLASSAVQGERKKGRGASSVAAVRGGKQKNMADPNEPTLKGDARAQKAQKEAALDDELAKAVDLVTSGKADDGLAALKAFKDKNPKYRTEDVDKAIEGAQAMLAEKAAASDKPAAPAADKTKD